MRQGFSGAVLVAERETVLLDKGYGMAGGTRLVRSSKFWIASMGKQFTSAAVLKCQEQGRVRLTDRISKYLPAVPEEKQSITVLQLLTHSSGFPQNYVSDGITDRAQAIAAILAQPLAQPPGTAFGYSNDNYVLAASIVEIVTGRRFEDFVREELLRPAGISYTGFAATPEAHSVAPLPGPLPKRLQSRHWGSVGAGAMFSTTSDLYAWYKALVSGKVLGRASVDQLFTPYQKIQEGASGLGWFVGSTGRGTRCIFTRGNDDTGANGLIYVYPDRQVTVVVLCHAGQKHDDASWSRAILAEIESRLRL
jgi:CubicO group peptidase (beta-lactamase class C family)